MFGDELFVQTMEDSVSVQSGNASGTES